MITAPQFIRSFAAAWGMLTALPFLRRIALNESDIRWAPAWYPLVGAIISLLTAGAATLAKIAGLDAEFQAFAALALPLLATRFFHFDGLCDTCDGLLTGKPADRILEIMKDSRIGSFALGGGFLFLLLSWLVLLVWARAGIPWILLAAPAALSRMGAAVLAANSRYPREQGLGKSIIGRGLIPTGALVCGVLMGLALAAVCGLAAFATMSALPQIMAIATLVGALVLAAGLVLLALRAWAYRRIEGITGDILGAGILLSELAMLAIVPAAVGLGRLWFV